MYGFSYLARRLKAGTDEKSIVFLHPKSSHGVLVELYEDQYQF